MKLLRWCKANAMPVIAVLAAVDHPIVASGPPPE